MKAHVIMGNDFPDGIVIGSDEFVAEHLKQVRESSKKHYGHDRIHWYSQPFDLVIEPGTEIVWSGKL